MPYQKKGPFINVPPSQWDNPPSGAVPMDADFANALEAWAEEIDEALADVGTGGGSDLLALAYTSASAEITTPGSGWQGLGAGLEVTFEAPASGRVLVRLAAGCKSPANGTAHNWGLIDTGFVLGGSERVVTSIDQWMQGAYTTLILGLTSGQSYTWAWAQQTNFGGGATQWGSGFGRAIMEVRSA